MDATPDGERDKVSFAVKALKEGLTIFLRNLQLLIPSLAIMVLSYFLLIFAVLSVIPAEKVQEITEKFNANDSEKIGEEVVRELSSYLNRDLTRTISIFLLFGLAVFVLQEFNTAGLAVSSLDLSKGIPMSISKFLENAFLHTFRMVQVDLVAILVAMAVASPLMFLFYLSQSLIFEMALPSILILVLLLTTFARFYAISGGGIFESYAKGTRFFFRNILGIIVLFLSWFVISFPLISLSFIFPPLIFLWPALLLLFYILMAKYYILVENREGSGGSKPPSVPAASV